MITGTAGGGLCRWVPRETRLSYRIAHLTPGLPSIANPAIRYRGTSKYRATKKSTCFQLVRLAESGKGKKMSSFPAPRINGLSFGFPARAAIGMIINARIVSKISRRYHPNAAIKETGIHRRGRSEL